MIRYVETFIHSKMWVTIVISHLDFCESLNQAERLRDGAYAAANG